MPERLPLGRVCVDCAAGAAAKSDMISALLRLAFAAVAAAVALRSAAGEKSRSNKPALEAAGAGADAGAALEVDAEGGFILVVG